MKLCSKCKTFKELKMFHNNKSSKDGKRHICKECAILHTLQHNCKNKEHYKEYNKEYHFKNKNKILERKKIYRLSRKAAERERSNKRRAIKLKATPKWADLETIKCIYEEAYYLQLEVDHIVPLQSNLVCGLHVADNLQLLSKVENIKKGNRVWPDMPKSL